MKRNKIIPIAALSAAVILIAGIFAGCGSSASGTAGTVSCTASEADYSCGTYSAANTTEFCTDMAESGYESTTSSLNASSAADVTEQKLIVTWSLTMETEKYEEAVAALKASVESAGGYIESEDESSYYNCNRYEYLTIRIPSGKAEEWISGTSAYGTITNRSKSTEDATLQYVDTESRLKALRAEQATLLDMMAKAEDMSDLITIQSELTDVNYQIESYESRIRVLDNRVDYTTVYLNIEEVSRETAAPQTFGEEIRETFLTSMDNLTHFLRAIAVGIIGNSVMIVLAAALIAAVVWGIRKIRKHHAKVRASRLAPPKADCNTENTDEGRADH